jgi:2',3'-cyclic-nucleotide 2'-phosphodiesterase (5'-nucleotidase family)
MSKITRRDSLKAGVAAGALAAAPLARPALAQGPAVPPAERPTFTLLLVNDIYKMGEEGGRGGFARLAAIVKAERAKGVPMLYCHAGDTFSPSLMSGFDQGAHIVELTNLAPPDVFVPGNHEFDFGKDVYFKRHAESRFPYFAANLRQADGQPLPGHRDGTVVDLGPVKVGVFGVALAGTPAASSPGDLVFGPEMETVRAQAAALRRAGADFVVAVTHTGFASDFEIFRSRLVDVLLTGHDHDLRVAYDGRVAMVESGEEGQYVTAVDVTARVATVEGRRTVTWRPNFRVVDSASVTPDPETLAIVRRYEADLSRELDVVIGSTAIELDSRSASVRSQETAIGNLIADALREATGAPIAITNGGGIRGNKVYPAGAQITRRDVLTELPFGNTTNLVEITGGDIVAALENGVSLFEQRAGRFPQVSGLAVVIDPSRPVGSRVVSVKVGERDLDLAARYRVASNNFMVAGGDGYAALGRGRTLIGGTDGKLMAGDVMTHVRRLGRIETRVEGRITIR